MNQTTAISNAVAKPIGVRVENVDLSYGKTQVLKNISLEIQPGEFFAFLGPSGCGKTTLLRLIAGFNQADRGRVCLGDEEVSHLPPWKRNVGMVFQSYALWPHLSVRDNVAFGLVERRLPRAEIDRAVSEALDLVGLGELADRRPSQLSGGQQQRVAVARTVAVRPKVLLLDEPLSNLDAKLRVQVRRELRELQQRLAITTIFVTHDQEEANAICDRIAVMNDGVVQQVGTPMELYDHPKNLFVAGFLGTVNILDGELRSDGANRIFETAGGRFGLPRELSIPPGGKMLFRPQDCRLARRSDPLDPNTVRLDGVVQEREFLGGFMRYAIAIGGSHVAVDVPHYTGQTCWESGNLIGLDLSLARVQFTAP